MIGNVAGGVDSNDAVNKEPAVETTAIGGIGRRRQRGDV